MQTTAPSRINIRNLDQNLLADFKAECARKGRTMKGLVTAFMRATIEQDPRIIDVGRLSRHYQNPR